MIYDNLRYLSIIVLLPVLAFAQTSGQTPSATDYFNQGVETLAASNSARILADKAILDANKRRKEIVSLRAQARKAAAPEIRQNLKRSADRLALELKALQTKGIEFRDTSKTTFKDALNLFEQGMVDKWGAQIRSRNPILMADSTSLFFAHNTKIRSVHPNMLNKMGTPTDEINDSGFQREMSLIVPALARQTAPPDLDISSFQISREQRYFAHIEVKPEQGFQSGDGDALLVPPNNIHKWLLLLNDLQGEPVTGANIEIVGHMPGHVHGLSTQPRVTRELSPGVYLVEGVKFQMKGWWVMQFNLEGKDNNSDSITFNLVL